MLIVTLPQYVTGPIRNKKQKTQRSDKSFEDEFRFVQLSTLENNRMFLTRMPIHENNNINFFNLSKNRQLHCRKRTTVTSRATNMRRDEISSIAQRVFERDIGRIDELFELLELPSAKSLKTAHHMRNPSNNYHPRFGCKILLSSI